MALLAPYYLLVFSCVLLTSQRAQLSSTKTIGMSIYFTASLALLASSTALPQLKVLPLGDSLTFGCGSDAAPPDWYACCTATSGGYRAPLWAALNGSSINASVSMVGTVSNGPSWVPAEQRAHEGHPGWTINQIAGLKDKWVSLQVSNCQRGTVSKG